MECIYCRSYNCKFYCKHCLTEKLTDHREELNILSTEKDEAVKESEAILEKTSKIHSLIVEKNMRTTNMNFAQQIDKLQKDLERRRSLLEDGKIRLNQNKKSIEKPIEKPIITSPNSSSNDDGRDNEVMKLWKRTYKKTIITRQILVKEVVSLFDLKPGVVEVDEGDTIIRTALNRNDDSMIINHSHHNIIGIARSQDQRTYSSDNLASIHNANNSNNSNNSNLQHSIMPFTRPIQTLEQKRQYEDLYICGVSLPARLIDVSRYPKDELNSAIGYTVQMLELIVQYLGIKLPFTIFRKDLRLYIRSIPHSRIYQNQSKMPLFLDNDKSFRRFLIGITMLNYDIAYLCYTQGVDIPLSQVANALQNIMACCNSPQLGLQSHSSNLGGIKDLNYVYDFQQVLRQTSLRYRCGSRPLSTNQGSVNSKIDQKFLKVRHSDFVGGKYDGEAKLYELSDDDEEDEEDDDDDLDDDDLFQRHNFNIDDDDDSKHNDEDDENHDENISSSNENWNIVDVMPAFVL
ncbi:unnamed protein product [Cunninghamella blakesleeana]